jgi:hypothetical protein
MYGFAMAAVPPAVVDSGSVIEPMSDQLFPIINAADVERSLAFWRDLLGGIVAFAWPGPDGAPIYVVWTSAGRTSPGCSTPMATR